MEEPVAATTAGKGEPHWGDQGTGREVPDGLQEDCQASVNSWESSEGPSERRGRTAGPGRQMPSRFPPE